ncbi:MAG: NTE family protein RssA [candidate division WS2 bacterium ADurb.Bin280]|uniref:NTE family protein RssA n=1 Tax=candidate division WS2 bacterium ADurb.Bin280 TaxID=1852829 RepID=A0A1V5SG66_9BACT|nr:MAG: NTE family protein RssA [candidate division WS2 bacterium ADurb.Bin280]
MKIGIALSGGGVLGAAHIGALKEIEKANIKIEYVCGASAGSIIGGIYSSSGIEGLEEFYNEISNKKGFSPNTRFQIQSPSRFFSELENTVSKYLEPKIDRPQIPFGAVATNLETGLPELLQEGDKLKNIMASCAYPGVFPIVRISSKLYVDGGIAVNLPAEFVKNECDFTIGSSIYSLPKIKKSYFDKNSRTRVLSRSLEIIENRLSYYQENYCDFCFKPQIKNLKWFHFWKLQEARDAGEANAKKQINDLVQLLNR